MIYITFHDGQGIKHSRTLTEQARHAADVVIQNQRVVKNRYGGIGMRLNIDVIAKLPTMTIDEQQKLFAALHSTE